MLDEEVDRLPEKYRIPFVLCHLEGKTNEEAARLLGCPKGTVLSRLARARDRLRQRLTRRGVVLSAGLFAAARGREAAAAVPAPLVISTVRAVALFAAGGLAVPGAIAPGAASLAQGVLKAMLVHKLKTAALVLLALGMMGAAAGVAVYRAHADESTAQADEKTSWAEDGAKPPPADAEESVPPPPAEPDAPGPGEVTYLTANFEVIGPAWRAAIQVGDRAEEYRKELALRWLGQEMPKWPRRCSVRVRTIYRAPGSSTSFEFKEGKVVRQIMNLDGPLDNVLNDLLPHEITHTVFAHHFGHSLPRWADEGAATLAERAAARQQHEKALRRILDDGQLLPLRQLLPLLDYPQDTTALYAEGYSLTRFLVERSGRRTFVAFVARGERDGWDKAALVHYGYRDVDDLERTWLADVGKSRPKEGRAEGTDRSGKKGLGKGDVLPIQEREVKTGDVGALESELQEVKGELARKQDDLQALRERLDCIAEQLKRTKQREGRE